MHPLRTAAEAAATVPAEVVSDSGPSALALGVGAAAVAGAIGTAVVRRGRTAKGHDGSAERTAGQSPGPEAGSERAQN
ncbi:hypothetical protein ACF09C_11375 [Streptomyces sp. NPDC014870]|uniref:hypothetical protein n=1 Tax=Streptomyces sp. NPDC014870 TaxID=3364925 RepID=UPI0036FCD9FF